MSAPAVARRGRRTDRRHTAGVIAAATWRAVRREWRHGRLSLVGLGGPTRVLAWLALAASATAALVILATGAGVALPLGVDRAPGLPFAEHEHPIRLQLRP